MIVLIRKDQSPMDLDSSSDQSQCRLLSLPAELRTQIWQLILVQCTQKTIHARLTNPAQEDSRTRARFCANILRTCKQVNAEGTPILYGENVFSAHTTLLASLPTFLLVSKPQRLPLSRPVTSPRVMKLIRRYHIFVRLDTDPRFSKRQVEESFDGVGELRVDVFQAMAYSCDFSVLKLFEGVRGVEKVVIQGSLGDRKYADWLEAAMQLPAGTSVTPYWEKFVGGTPAWDAWTNGNR